MKSRATTWLLAVAVAAIWGVVIWKIFTPADDDAPSSMPARPAPIAVAALPDTLLLDYPDPFLKGAVRVGAATPRPVVRSLPVVKPAPKREPIAAVHLGTVGYGGKTLYILTLGGRQYELARGDTAEDFVLTGSDRDSLYLRKGDVTYGVELCD